MGFSRGRQGREGSFSGFVKNGCDLLGNGLHVGHPVDLAEVALGPVIADERSSVLVVFLQTHLEDFRRVVLADRLTGRLCLFGPLDDPDAPGAALVLFLYRVVPNASLRNREHRVPSSTPGQVNVFQNALPLDLYYLLTVGTTPGASEETLLRALGFAMLALSTAATAFFLFAVTARWPLK